jgi:3-hydroxyisobutyrate dehydrogenase-like beta-hydroxyacid dehydrogenase
VSAAEPSTVSVIGLGNMGAALARALVQSGRPVTVWNRSPDRAQPLVAAGASHSEDLAEVVGASSILVVCVSSYEVGTSLLQECAASLQGKTIVQCTAGPPDQAVAMADWARERGAAFVEGMMMVLPQDVGTDRCRALYAGDEQDFGRVKSALTAFGGAQVWLGPRVGAVAALTMASIGFFWLTVEAFTLMVSVAHSFGVELEPALEELRGQQRVIGLAMEDSLAALAGKVWAADTVNIERGAHNSRMVADLVEAQGFDPSALRVVQEHLAEADAAGYGEAPVGAIVHALRSGSHEAHDQAI